MKKTGVNAEIISVGTEILLGHLVNTNAAYLSRKLSGLGINLFRRTVIGDNPARLASAVQHALRRADIVITCGGLGPTVDDITISAVSRALSLPLVLNKRMAASIKKFFKRKHLRMPDYVIKQAYVPKGAAAIENKVGTAPASIVSIGGKTVIALPGPPREMAPIVENAVVPYLRKKYALRSIIFTRTLKIADIPESAINKMIKSFLAMRGAATTGIYAHPGEVDIRITAKANGKKEAFAQIGKIERKLLRVLGKRVYGFDGDTLEKVVGRQLVRSKKILSVAESCTGGLIADRITDIPGSSGYFDRGIVSYSDRSKAKELGVGKRVIQKFGAVSRPAAVAMAKGLLKRSSSDIALAVTGIAGPSGGTKKKPVGLVFIALAQPERTRCMKRYFLGSRADIKRQAATAALELLRKTLTTDDGRSLR